MSRTRWRRRENRWVKYAVACRRIGGVPSSWRVLGVDKPDPWDLS